MEDLTSDEMRVRQRATALWLIDKLALRVGNEKDDDEADTVGCCSLRVEHVTLEKHNKITLDFLGKDSIHYHNSVEVIPQVYNNIKDFMARKKKESDLFDKLSTITLNNYLKKLMPGLTAKVFRTYNASITLQRELEKTPEDGTINDKLIFYNRANREVAVLCNHQKSLPKTHTQQMERLTQKKDLLQEELDEYERIFGLFKKGKYNGEQPNLPEKPPAKKIKTEGESITPEKSTSSAIKSDVEDMKIDSAPSSEKKPMESSSEEKPVAKASGSKTKHEATAKTPVKSENEGSDGSAKKLTGKKRKHNDSDSDSDSDEERNKTPKKRKPLKQDQVVQKMEKLRVRIDAINTQMQVKEDLKTVALGTSKINYLDPRITVAWCTKHSVPLEKIFNKSLLNKFPWAMQADEDWVF